MIVCTGCQQTEGIVSRIGGDGLCEECRLVLARAQVASQDRCTSCGEPEETAEGLIDLDAAGLCDACREQREHAQVLAADQLRYGDFDFSLNF